jgi:hypothetical protein
MLYSSGINDIYKSKITGEIALTFNVLRLSLPSSASCKVRFNILTTLDSMASTVEPFMQGRIGNTFLMYFKAAQKICKAKSVMEPYRPKH